ncbi:MAG TPA: PfkB family carbohydrate kinase [Dehalococcoidia bacterium]
MEHDTPTFLVVGHITRDRVAGTERPGGVASYAAAVAARLGVSAAVLTSAADDLELPAELAGVRIERLPAPQTTTMEHIWRGREREQFVLARAALLGPSAVPADLRAVPIVLLGSVTGEVSVETATVFPAALRGATLQGWLRRAGDGGRVEAIAPAVAGVEAILSNLDAAFLSEEDLGASVDALRPLLDGWARRVRVLAVTRGDLGALIAIDGDWYQIGVFPARELEGTGAGDAFAAAFLIRYYETAAGAAGAETVADAVRFAAATASFVVEARGVAGAPARAQVEARLAAHPGVRLRRL